MPANVKSSRASGYAFAVLAAAVLSTTAVLIRHLSLAYGLPALVMAFWRDVAVVLTLGAALAAFRRDLLRPGRARLAFLGIYGLVVTSFNVMWTLSVTINGAAAATVLAYCSGAFSVALGRWLLKEALTPAKVAATLLSLSGCALVSDALHAAAWRSNFAGIAAGVLSGLTYAAYSLMGRSASRRGLDPWTTLLYSFGFAAVYLMLLNLAPGGIVPGGASRPKDFFWLGRSGAGWGILFLLGAGPTVVGFGLYLKSLVHLPSGVANLVVSLEPAFTAIFAFLALGERLRPIQAAGGLLILAGVVVLRLGERAVPEGRPADPCRAPGS